VTATGRYHWDRLTATEQAGLLAVQQASYGHICLEVLNVLAGAGLIEWRKRGRSNQVYPVLGQRGASAISHWRRAS
jgi:hypothetical protein